MKNGLRGNGRRIGGARRIHAGHPDPALAYLSQPCHGGSVAWGNAAISLAAAFALNKQKTRLRQEAKLDSVRLKQYA